MTKDCNFPKLVLESGSPPHVIWINCGNASNAALKEILAKRLNEALGHIRDGEPLVEIQGR